VIRGLFLPDALPSTVLVVSGTAFILFTNYMITDPQTSPSRPRDQVLFGAATAAVYGILVAAHITFGLFYALTLVCAGRFLLALGRRIRSARAERPASPLPQADPVRTRQAAQVAG